MNEDTESGFLQRWSRRKARSVDREEHSEPGSRETAPEAAVVGTPPEPLRESRDVRPAADGDDEEPVKTDEDMPDLDTIDETTDMSGFFSPGVSDVLRQQALRRLFRLPKFNVTDGLDDYNQDFRNFEALGDIVTSDMRHRMEMEQERAAAEREEAHGEADTGVDGEVRDVEEPGRVEPAEEADEIQEAEVAREGEFGAGEDET